MSTTPANKITKTSTNSVAFSRDGKNRSSLEPSPSRSCDLARMQALVSKVDRAHGKKPEEAYAELCQRRVLALLLESQLYSQSERQDREVLEATARRAAVKAAETDQFDEVRKAAGSVFC